MVPTVLRHATSVRSPRGVKQEVLSDVPGLKTWPANSCPAVLYLSITATRGGSPSGWAVPMATDIAFALGVLAVLRIAA